MNNDFWDYAERQLHIVYGDNPSIEIVERFETERLQFGRDTEFHDMILFLGKLRVEAEESRADLGNRGQIHNAFIGWLIGATRVNPLPPHYYCPSCKRIDFIYDVADGWDLPAKKCSCGANMNRDGHNLSSSTLFKNMAYSSDVNLPGSFHEKAKEILESHYESPGYRGVYRVLLNRDTDGQGIGRYSVLSKWMIDDEELTEGNVLHMSSDRFYEHYADEIYYLFIPVNVLEMLQNLSLATKQSLEDIDFLEKEVLESFKKGGAFREYLEHIPNYRSEDEDEMKWHSLPYYLDHYPFEKFSDLLKYEGLTHNTYGPSHEIIGEMLSALSSEEVIAFREDVFDYVYNAMKKKGVRGYGLATEVCNMARKGMYSSGRMSTHTRNALLSLGVSEKYIERLSHALYLFPRGHCIDWLRLHMMAAWFAVHFPTEFNREFERIKNDTLNTDEQNGGVFTL